MIRPWLKAGLVGGAILGMLTVLSTFSLFLSESVRDLVTCCVCCLQMSIYPAVGILAAFWIISPRSTGQGARTGALAGLVAGGVDGVVTLLAGLASVMLGASQRYLADLPVDVFNVLRDTGLMTLFTPGGLIAITVCSTPIFTVWAAACGTLGGTVYAAAKPD